ncbi:MAG: YegS/Rv2252/BmrU family lipid kinase [Lachnospiraceae bacterium]|nr:YegS/Rv2252/BmrU family lipid kinase [Lachnospiraceae bacterium]
MKNLLFIYNPYSGKGMVKENLSDIIDCFVKNGYQVSVYPTQGRMDAKDQVIHMASLYDMVVCSGGDGTLNEVISGLMELPDKPVLGYIPAGSTNDFGQSIKLPKTMIDAAKVAVSGTPISVDIGSFRKRKFVYIAGFGAFTDVSYMTPQEMKNVLGHSAYLLDAVTKLTTLRTYHMKVTYDGNNEVEGDYLYGMITNSISVGGFKGITGKNVALDDGLFEVTLIKRPKNPIDLNLVLGSMIGMDFKTDSVVSFKASEIIFEAEQKVPWVLDGEYGGSPRKVKITNNKKAIRIMSGISKNN